MPDFEAAYQEFGDDIHFVMVNTTGMMDETQSAAEEFLAGEGYTFPVYYDLDLDAAATYGIVAYPPRISLTPMAASSPMPPAPSTPRRCRPAST